MHFKFISLSYRHAQCKVLNRMDSKGESEQCVQNMESLLIKMKKLPVLRFILIPFIGPAHERAEKK